MKKTDLPYKNNPDTEWQLLGELKLSVAADPNSTVSSWLTETLIQLDLHIDLFNKVIYSAQEAVANIIQTNTLLALEHLHLQAFAPVRRTTKGKSWGFFRIERFEKLQIDKGSPDHTIDFYLYQE